MPILKDGEKDKIRKAKHRPGAGEKQKFPPRAFSPQFPSCQFPKSRAPELDFSPAKREICGSYR